MNNKLEVINKKNEAFEDLDSLLFSDGLGIMDSDTVFQVLGRAFEAAGQDIISSQLFNLSDTFLKNSREMKDFFEAEANNRSSLISDINKSKENISKLVTDNENPEFLSVSFISIKKVSRAKEELDNYCDINNIKRTDFSGQICYLPNINYENFIQDLKKSSFNTLKGSVSLKAFNTVQTFNENGDIFINGYIFNISNPKKIEKNLEKLSKQKKVFCF